MYDEILSSIDNIDDCIMEAELNVLNALCDEYDKALMIYENYNGDSYDCFDIFQESVIMEDGESRFKKIISAPVNLIKMLIDLIKKFVGMCRDKIKTIKVNKAVSKAKQKMSDEELHEFTQRFGSGKIEFKNGDITVVSDINIDLLRKNIDKFDIGKNDGYYDHDMEKVFEKSEYPLQQYINDIDILCLRLENEVIKEYEEWIKFWNSNFPDLDKVSMYDDPCKLKLEWIKSARDNWNKILIKITSELIIVQKFTNQIMHNKKSPSDEELFKKYVTKDGKVQRSKIALDVADLTLSRHDIIRLCYMPEVKYAFIGQSYSKKEPQEKWNKEYLDKLVCASAAESFNKDYLLYLNDVAEYVMNSKKKKRR